MMYDIVEVLWGTNAIDAIQEFFGPGWHWFFETVTLFGAHELVAVVIAAALWLHGRRLAYALLGLVALTLATDMLLWQLVGVPRPSGAGIVVYRQATVSSFPSGHVVVATTVWGLLALRSRLPKLTVVLIVLAVMLSRLYLGMHYLGDVLGGVLIGLLLLRVYDRVWPTVAHWFAQRSFHFFLLLGLALALAVLPFTSITTRAWVAFGGALGAAIGLPCEYRYVRYTPGTASFGWQALKLLIGLGLAGAMMFGLKQVDWSTPIFDAAVFALTALWLTLGAPALFAELGLSRRTQLRQ